MKRRGLDAGVGRSSGRVRRKHDEQGDQRDGNDDDR
jgi:hypothetical protein